MVHQSTKTGHRLRGGNLVRGDQSGDSSGNRSEDRSGIGAATGATIPEPRTMERLLSIGCGRQPATRLADTKVATQAAIGATTGAAIGAKTRTAIGVASERRYQSRAQSNAYGASVAGGNRVSGYLSGDSSGDRSNDWSGERCEDSNGDRSGDRSDETGAAHNRTLRCRIAMTRNYDRSGCKLK